MEKESLKGNEIIIVEDDYSIQKTLFLILKDNYQISLFSNAEEALGKVKNGSIDLIISDLKLPGMSGLEMIETLRKFGYEGKVILISAYPDLLNSQVIEKLGVDYLFVKPLDLNKLNVAIKLLLG